MLEIIEYSIVLATFNGDKYLIQQLDSIRNQTARATEVLIFDDCSTDDTVKIINNYITHYNLDWNLEINLVNLGWKKNFINGISKATKDFIFLCDQDDIWERDKCELMITHMNKLPDCNLMMTNYRPFTTNKNIHFPISMLFQINNRRLVNYKTKSRSFLSVYRPGCSYCLRRSFFNRIKYLWYEGIAHDEFIYHLSLIYCSTYLLHYKAIKFRRHENNNSPKNIRNRQSRLSEVIRLQILFSKYQKELSRLNPQDIQGTSFKLERVQRFLTLKTQFYLSPSFSKWLILVTHYYSLFPTVKNMLGELYIGLISNK